MYRIRKDLRPCPNPYYINVAWFHLPRPDLKVDGEILSIISVESGEDDGRT